MYEGHFGLTCLPFENTPNPKFFFASECHREALATLVYGVEKAKGFMMVTGEVGTGKTMLVRSLKEKLGDTYSFIEVASPWISGREFLRELPKQLGLDIDEDLSETERQSQIKEYLLERHNEGHRVVVIVDEAQQLSEHTLEGVRLLSNMETETSKLIQLVLLGQTELSEMLARHSMRQLRQRIALNRELKSLSRESAINYIDHRLKVAGGSSALFSPEALKAVCEYSQGIPRVINLICDNCLITAYAAGASQVVEQVVREVVADLPVSVAVPSDNRITAPVEVPLVDNSVENARLSEAQGSPASPVESEAAVIKLPFVAGSRLWVGAGFCLLLLVAVVSFLMARSMYQEVPANAQVPEVARSTDAAPQPVAEAASRLPQPQREGANAWVSSSRPSLDRREPAYGHNDRIQYWPELEEDTGFQQGAQNEWQGVIGRAQAVEGRPLGALLIENPYRGIGQNNNDVVQVQAGETISVIARRQYQTWNDTIDDIVRSANPHVRNLDSVAVGDSIILPNVTRGGLVVQGRQGAWYLYFSSFRNMAKAEQQLASLQALGDVALLLEDKRGTAPFYRVYFGAFSSRAQAESKAESLWYRYMPFLN